MGKREARWPFEEKKFDKKTTREKNKRVLSIIDGKIF